MMALLISVTMIVAETLWDFDKNTARENMENWKQCNKSPLWKASDSQN